MGLSFLTHKTRGNIELIAKVLCRAEILIPLFSETNSTSLLISWIFLLSKVSFNFLSPFFVNIQKETVVC